MMSFCIQSQWISAKWENRLRCAEMMEALKETIIALIVLPDPHLSVPAQHPLLERERERERERDEFKII